MSKNKKTVILFTALTGITIAICYCIYLFTSPKTTQIKIAVPVDVETKESSSSILQCLEIAKEDAKLAGKELGLDIDIVVEGAKDDFTAAVDFAQKYSEDKSVMAVIGHEDLDACTAVSNLYVKKKKVLMSPISCVVDNRKDFSDYIFQCNQNDSEIGTTLTEYASELGSKRAVIFYGNSTCSRNIANTIEQYSELLGIDIIDKFCGFTSETISEQIYNQWCILNCDTFFFVSGYSEGIDAIKVLRFINKDVKCICADDFYDDELIKDLEDDANGLHVCSLYDDSSYTDEMKAFSERYKEKYGKEPDIWGMMYYDNINIILDAIIKHNVRSSDQLKDYLQNASEIDSMLYGKFHFEDNKIVGLKSQMKKVENLKFIPA